MRQELTHDLPKLTFSARLNTNATLGSITILLGWLGNVEFLISYEIVTFWDADMTRANNLGTLHLLKENHRFCKQTVEIGPRLQLSSGHV